MTTVFVDLVNLDGSRPEGSLRFSLERLVLGDPDVVPSAVEVKIRDGKARVDDLLPGAMRVRVNAGCWSKDWHITVPESGEHDLFELLEWQAEDFQETVWAALSKRVEALENAPVVDLAPLEKRLDALEAKPDPKPFDPSALETQLADMQAHLTPVEIYTEGIGDDLGSVSETGANVTVVQHAGRVDINISAFDLEGLLRALDGLKLPHFPKVSDFPHGGSSMCDVELFQGAKFVAKLQPYLVRLQVESLDDVIPSFVAEVDSALAVVQETGANRMSLSTFYYTNDLPPTE